MKKIKWWLLVFLTIACSKASTQDFCLTHSDIPDVLQGITQYQIVQNSYIVRIFFHIIRRSNGTGGQTLAEINTALNVLNEDYTAHGISFSLLGIDEISDDATYNRTNFEQIINGQYVTDSNGDGKFDIFHPNSHPNAIDIYLFANDRLNFGLASGIPGTALVIGGNSFGSNLASSHTLSHEIAHCLGLYHTFHGLCEGGCVELPNGSNSSSCGDFVSDTPADPQLFQVNQNTCSWNGTTCNGTNGNLYNPDTHLIMAYVPPSCMQYHTQGQGVRMRTTIASSSLLRNATEVYSSVFIGDRTYPTLIENLLGRHIFNITGDYIEFTTNTTINNNATVNVRAREKVVLKPGFWAKPGSTVSLKITNPVSMSSSLALSEETTDDEATNIFETDGNRYFEISSIQVYSLTGLLVYSSKTNFDLKSTNLNTGIYIVEKMDTEGNIVREKVILKR
jgi:hypothetical protein